MLTSGDGQIARAASLALNLSSFLYKAEKNITISLLRIAKWWPDVVGFFLSGRRRETGSPDGPGDPRRHASWSGQNRPHDRRRGDGDPEVRVDSWD